MKLAIYDKIEGTYYCGNGKWEEPDFDGYNSEKYRYCFAEHQPKTWGSIIELSKVYGRITKNRSKSCPHKIRNHSSWTWKTVPHSDDRYEIKRVETQTVTLMRYENA